MMLSRVFIIQITLVIISKLLLEYSYIFIVHPLFKYAGFVFDFNLAQYLFGWFIYIGTYLILYSKNKLSISEIYFFIFLLWFLPNIVFYGLADQNTVFFLALSLPFIAIVLLTTQKKIFKIQYLPKSKLLILIISLVAVLLVIINYYMVTGGKVVLSFYQVYEFRDEFGVNSTSGIFGYLNSWASKIFAVVLLAWSIYKKKYTYILLSIGLILLLFVLSGHKGVLSSIVLVIFFYVLSKLNFDNYILLLFGFIGLLSFVIVLHMLDVTYISSLIIRRLLMVPAHLNFTYLEFFSTNEFVYWSNGILKSFIQYPYDIRLVQVIGEYLGKPDMAANTGFIASGYAHSGYLGIIIYTFIAIVLFNIINQVAKNNEKYFVMAIMFPILLTLFKSSDLLTTLLTHGLFIAIIVLWLFNNKNYKLKIGKFKYEI